MDLPPVSQTAGRWKYAPLPCYTLAASRSYFLEIIRGSGEPMLDLACGTGRTLLDYYAIGIDIDGVDISPEMIAKCKENAQAAELKPNLYVQAMQSLNLPRRYNTIIVPPHLSCT